MSHDAYMCFNLAHQVDTFLAGIMSQSTRAAMEPEVLPIDVALVRMLAVPFEICFKIARIRCSCSVALCTMDLRPLLGE